MVTRDENVRGGDWSVAFVRGGERRPGLRRAPFLGRPAAPGGYVDGEADDGEAHLRQKMLDELQRRNCSQNTVAYDASVGRLCERISRSRALPILTTMGSNASISASDVRKFTMHARSANFPWTTALER